MQCTRCTQMTNNAMGLKVFFFVLNVQHFTFFLMSKKKICWYKICFLKRKSCLRITQLAWDIFDIWLFMRYEKDRKRLFKRVCFLLLGWVLRMWPKTCFHVLNMFHLFFFLLCSHKIICFITYIKCNMRYERTHLLLYFHKIIYFITYIKSNMRYEWTDLYFNYYNFYAEENNSTVWTH